MLVRTRGKAKQSTLKPSKMQLGEARSQLKDSKDIQAKLRVLQQNKIPVGVISELYDPTLNEFIAQAFTSVPIELIEFLQKLDAPLEEKLEILEEFNNLAKALKDEFLNELADIE